MRKYFATLLAALFALPLFVYAVNITVPSAPGANYYLSSTSTGQYLTSKSITQANDPTIFNVFHGVTEFDIPLFGANGVTLNASTTAGTTFSLTPAQFCFLNTVTIPAANTTTVTVIFPSDAATSAVCGSLTIGEWGTAVFDNESNFPFILGTTTGSSLTFRTAGNPPFAAQAYPVEIPANSSAFGIPEQTSNNTAQFMLFTTQNFGSTYASTTALTATTICLTGDICRTTWPTSSGGAGVWPFTTGLSNFGVPVQATTTPEWFQTGLFASSTSQLAFASTTALSAINAVYTGAGTVSAPSFQISGGEGLYQSNTSELGFTNGVTSVRWDGTNFYPGTTNARNLGIISTNLWNNLYVNFASTTALSTVSLFVTGQAAGCAQFDANAKLTSTGVNCGSGGGGGSGGQWSVLAGAIYNSTTTDQVLIDETSTTTAAKLEVNGLSAFKSGYLSLASSTVGAGTKASGLTIAGGSTTTLNAYFATGISVGTSSPEAPVTFAQTGGLTSPEFVIDGVGAGAGAEMELNRTNNSGVEANIDFNTAGAERWQLGMQNNNTDDFELWQGTTDNPVFAINQSSLDVNIGTTTCGNTIELCIWGDTSANDSIFAAMTSASTSAFIVNNNGNVGINGTSSPYAKLAIASISTGDETPTIVVDGAATANGNADIAFNRANSGTAESNIDFNTAGVTNWQLGTQNVATNGNDFILSTGANASVLTVKANTNVVGVGTSTPFWELTVATGTAPQLALSDGNPASNEWTLRTINGIFYLATSTAVATSSTSAFTILNNGRTGLSTSSPGTQLSINNVANFAAPTSTLYTGINITQGCFSVNGACITSGTAGTAGADPFTHGAYLTLTQVVSATSAPIEETGGFIVSSTTDPISNLGGSTNAGSWPVVINNPNSTNGSSTGIAFQVSANPAPTGGAGAFGIIGGGIGFIRQGANSIGDLFFSTTPLSGNNTERVRITSNGFVGIATTSPNAQLTVASSTGSQFSLADGGNTHNTWNLRTSNNTFYLATSTNFATSSVAALSFDPNGFSTFAQPLIVNGFGTTTFTGNVIVGTTTSLTGVQGPSGSALLVSNSVTGAGGIIDWTRTNTTNALSVFNSSGLLIFNVDDTTTGGATFGIGTSTLAGIPFMARLTIGNYAGDTIPNFLMFASSTPTATTTIFQITSAGHIIASSTNPVVTCTSGSLTSFIGDDSHGEAVCGAASTAIVVTFAQAWSNAPICTVTNQSMSITSAMSYVPTATTLTISQAVGLAGDKVDFICEGVKGPQ